MLQSLIGSLALLAATSAPASARGDAEEIDALRWKSRLLVVIAPTADDPRAGEQRRLFRAARAGSAERDLVLVEAAGADPRARAIRHRFGVPEGEFRAILVGKDGGAKLASAKPIPTTRLFEEIDAMPMRQDEMRRPAGRGR